MTGDFAAAARDLAAAMAALGQPWMVIGGVAVISHGVPRATIDIDATVVAPGTTAARVFTVFERHGFRDLDDVERLLAAHPDGVDRPRVTRILSDLSRLLEDDSRLDTWERLQQRVGE